MKCHMGVSSAVFGKCTILACWPSSNATHCEVSSVQWQRHGGRFWYDGCRRHVMVMLPCLFICPGIPGNSRPPQVSPPSFISSCTELTVLWGMSESWCQVIVCDLIRAPGVSALFSFIFPSAAVSFAEHVDDLHLFPREQWSIFDLPPSVLLRWLLSAIKTKVSLLVMLGRARELIVEKI